MFIVPLRHKMLNFASLMHRRRIHHCGACSFLYIIHVRISVWDIYASIHLFLYVQKMSDTFCGWRFPYLLHRLVP